MEENLKTRGMLRVHGKHGEGLEWRGKERKRRRSKEEEKGSEKRYRRGKGEKMQKRHDDTGSWREEERKRRVKRHENTETRVIGTEIKDTTGRKNY